MTPVPTIGFDRRIKLEWLERTASLALLGGSPQEIRGHLRDILSAESAGEDGVGQEGREKSLRLLMRIWVTPRDGLEPLQDAGLQHFGRLPATEHLPLHWGMTMAAYPFFGTVAEAVGRLLRLQGTAGAAQVQRRMRERFGDRQFVERPTRHVLRTLIDWGVLEDGGEKGVYRAGPILAIHDAPLVLWLVEAALQANGSHPVPLHAITSAPAFFPFALEPISAGAAGRSERLEVFRQGVDEDLVALR